MYKFCPQCGGPLAQRLLKPGEPPRLVCTECGFIFYIDPKLAAIALVPLDGGLVLVRRSIDPGYGLWVVPGGFVDAGEPLEEAVVRETLEETHLQVRVARLFNVYSYKNHLTVVAAYVTQYVAGDLTAGDETLEARVFKPAEIPWDAIAFTSTRDALKEYLQLF
ncbi:MAG: NUDIX hydrolase [Deltaproteobacteria bacterium RBG_13_60_28]|nr:MAG: NUDIX hydrolase [Deltaproteobacteria bacterium RBG_13_60_28]